MKLTGPSIIHYLQDTLQVESALDVDSRLFSTGELDSMAMMQLIMFIEEKGGIQVSSEDVTLDNFDTVADILKYAEAQAA